MRPPVGISACLLGQEVRYDGGHKRSTALADELAEKLEWVPVCPEIGAGMGVPRPPVKLIGTAENPRMVTRNGGRYGGRDWTDEMLGFAETELDRLAELHICGFVFKSRSPSCGLRDIPASEGLFARALRRRFADLPVADEEELEDPARRRAFADAVLALANARGML